MAAASSSFNVATPYFVYGTSEYIDEGLLSYLTEVAGRFVLAIEVTKELRELGELGSLREVVAAAKYWASELVLVMSTGKYVSGLASELGELMTRTPLGNEVSKEELIDLLADVIAAWIKFREGEAYDDEASYLISRLSSVFGIDLSRAPILRSIKESRDLGLAVQACLLSILISVGGVGHANDIAN